MIVFNRPAANFDNVSLRIYELLAWYFDKTAPPGHTVDGMLRFGGPA